MEGASTHLGQSVLQEGKCVADTGGEAKETAIRKFDFNEFTSIIVPGATLLIGVALCNSSIREAILDQFVTRDVVGCSEVVEHG